jgi:hypothetical protein
MRARSLQSLSARYLVFSLSTICLPSAGAFADEPSATMFSLAGFGTVCAVHSNASEADFATSALNPNGAGFSHNWDTSVDSLVTMQVTGRFTSKLSTIPRIASSSAEVNKRLAEDAFAIGYIDAKDVDARVRALPVP